MLSWLIFKQKKEKRKKEEEKEERWVWNEFGFIKYMWKTLRLNC